MGYIIKITKGITEEEMLLAYKKMAKDKKADYFYLHDDDVDVAKEENPVIKVLINKINRL